jgi:phosphate/sulfate permease
MMTALLAAALSLNLATALGSPVATTHSIVGAVLGSEVAAASWGVANWATIANIAASWVVSPLFGGVIAAVLPCPIERTITHPSTRARASRRVMPVLLALMGFAFASYLALKGLSQLIKISFQQLLMAGAVVAAAVTVTIASQMALPISTTHVTIGAVFGVGFLREYLKASYARIIAEIEEHHRNKGAEQHEVEAFLLAFEAASSADKDRMLKELKAAGKRGEAAISKAERKGLREVHREDLVKRMVMMRVTAAWIITVPSTVVLSTIIFLAARGMRLSA